MKKILIVGAGEAQIPLIAAAKKENYHTIVCDFNPDAPGVPMADEYCRISTKDRRGLFEIAKEKRIDGIVANSEYAMCDVAFISSKLGLVGNSEKSIKVLSSKSLFRKLQRRTHLFAPKNRVDVRKDENSIQEYPIIIKPDMNSGTRGTTVARHPGDEVFRAIDECARLSRNGRVIVEDYVNLSTREGVEGEIFIHNGEILWDGFFTAKRSDKTPMIPITYVFPVQEDEDRIDRLKKSLAQAFHAAGVVHGEYNIEAFFVENEPFIIEINPRQGGNNLPRYVQEYCGIDLYRLLVTTSVGDDSYWDSLRNYNRPKKKIIHHMLYPEKQGRFMGVQISDKIKNKVFGKRITVVTGEKIERAKDGSASIGYVDLFFSDEGEEQKQIQISDEIEELIRIEIDENRAVNS